MIVQGYKIVPCHSCHVDSRFVDGAFTTDGHFVCRICALRSEKNYWCCDVYNADGSEKKIVCECCGNRAETQQGTHFYCYECEYQLKRKQEEEQAQTEFTGPMVRTLRKHFQYTQQQLANVLGVTRITIWSWETGQSKPRQSHVKAMLALYKQK